MVLVQEHGKPQIPLPLVVALNLSHLAQSTPWLSRTRLQSIPHYQALRPTHFYNQSVNLGNQISAKQDKLTAGDGITIENNVISATGGGGGSGGTRTATKFTKYTDFHNAFSNFEIGGFMNFYEIDPSNEYPYNGYLYFNGVITDKTSSNIVIDGRGFFFKGKYGWIDNSEVFKVEIYNNDVDYKIKVTYILQSSLNNSEAIPNEKDVLTFPNGANFHGYIVYVSP